jgi:general secretion pathway protein C
MRLLVKYIGIINLVLLVGFSYLLADLVSLFVGQRLEVSPSLPPVETLTDTAGQATPAREMYRAILDRNIFNLKPVAAIAQQDTASAEQVERTPLALSLIGTVAGGGRLSVAIIQDPSTKEEHLYHIGDLVGTDGKLLEIERNRVVVLRGGSVRETLEVNFSQKSPKKARPRRTSLRQAPTRTPMPPTGQTQFTLDKQEVNAQLQNLPELLTQARIIPHINKDGQNEGFRIVSIRPNSFYQRIGLRNGDVLQQINGIEIKDPGTFMSVFNQLKDESSITVDLVRNNQKETLSYEIR